MPAGVGETGPAGGGNLLIQGDNLAKLLLGLGLAQQIDAALR